MAIRAERDPRTGKKTGVWVSGRHLDKAFRILEEQGRAELDPRINKIMADAHRNPKRKSR